MLTREMEVQPKKVSIQADMDETDADTLNEMARKQRTSRADLVRKILGAAIDSYRRRQTGD